ncbi:MAG: hypothetical protein JOZ86_16965 [Candidatus Eremiobacteraeota bacterium]|nr:hypothetical protein [Candidatus Eremiobacteraeota bacterium]
MSRASFVITIPNATSSAVRRTPRNVPANTKSISFTLIKSDNAGVTPGAPALYPLTATSPGCVSGGNGITCTIAIQAPLGTDIFEADLYSTTDGSGTKLGGGTVKITVQNNTTNTASLSLFGPVASVVLTTDDTANDGQVPFAVRFLSLLPNITLPGVPTQVVPQSARIFVVALDAQGNQIIAPDTFTTPVTLTVANYVPPSPSSAARRPLIVVNPPAQTYVSLSVQYTFPQGGVTSATTNATTPSIPVLSPADKTVITALGGTLPDDLVVTATVNGTVQASELPFETLISACPAGDVGTPPFNCTLPTPTPSPTPTATPTPPALAWTNPNNYVNFTQVPFSGNASFEAQWVSGQLYTPYTFQVNETTFTGQTITANATSCLPSVATITVAGAPSPSPSPSPTPSPMPTSPTPPPTPTPTPSPTPVTIATSNAQNPQFTIYVPQNPSNVSCMVKATDPSSHEADLTVTITEVGAVIQRHGRQPQSKGVRP